MIVFSILSMLSALVSAVCWWHASRVKIGRERALEMRRKESINRGEEPSLSSVTLDGWDMSATFQVQAQWNSRGAFFASLAIFFQVLESMFGYCPIFSGVLQ